ncbi:MAG TPA: prephenate dehydratase [Bacteroidetes bacterium]|nr:prephenate dehydratase [Bacteroidota bacterium]
MISMPTIAYQGEPGAFSEQAAQSFFGPSARLLPLESFKDVFQHAAKHPANFGIVPIENSVYGSVHQNYDLLLRHKLFIVGELKLRIQLHVMALRGVSLKAIRFIYSHPQALGQCEEFLRSLKGASVVAYYDTAGSAKMIQEEGRRDAAALASARAAQAYGLRILRRNVESNHHNYTRFIVLSRRATVPTRHAKMSLVFAVKDIPGALFKALAVFALREINLLKIESRPLVGRPWEYLFYLDIEGTQSDERVRQALDHLGELATFVRILGCYPAGKTIRS